MIGHLTPANLDTLAAFQGRDLRASTQQISTTEDHGPLEASEMLHDWMDEARKNKQGIVAFDDGGAWWA